MPLLKEKPPRLLLHACCAPCSVAVIDELRRSRDLTVFFYNPNIHPLAEYLKRKAEVVRVCREWVVPMVDWDYETEKWEREAGGITQEKEGGPRCSACIRLRLATAATYALEHGFDSFATSLSSGRQKKSVVVNAIGRAVGSAVGVPFLDEDWKKGGRMEKALDYIEKMAIYRQEYCGCRFSREKTRKGK
ncbi:MAG: epoxyqueuosine reductase QueH [Patescibacteria group bacterium]|nr:epoxyqueuosine reductase QueH [Patescibacteria group bacterium]